MMLLLASASPNSASDRTNIYRMQVSVNDAKSVRLKIAEGHEAVLTSPNGYAFDLKVRGLALGGRKAASVAIGHLSINPAVPDVAGCCIACAKCLAPGRQTPVRSEEHTSELQSRGHLVC